MQITRSYNTTTFIYWKNKVLVLVPVVVESKISIHYYNIVYPMICVIKLLAFD
jgi:hypothetical protein